MVSFDIVDNNFLEILDGYQYIDVGDILCLYFWYDIDWVYCLVINEKF